MCATVRLSTQAMTSRVQDTSSLWWHTHTQSHTHTHTLSLSLTHTHTLTQAEYDKLRKTIIDMVLATDMKQHFAIVSHFTTVCGCITTI